MTRKITIPVAGGGSLMGEHHPGAKLSDADVELIRRIYDEGLVGYRSLARAFGVPRTTIMSICRYERRGCVPEGYKVVRVD